MRRLPKPSSSPKSLSDFQRSCYVPSGGDGSNDESASADLTDGRVARVPSGIRRRGGGVGCPTGQSIRHELNVAATCWRPRPARRDGIKWITTREYSHRQSLYFPVGGPTWTGEGQPAVFQCAQYTGWRRACPAPSTESGLSSLPIGQPPRLIGWPER